MSTGTERQAYECGCVSVWVCGYECVGEYVGVSV